MISTRVGFLSDAGNLPRYDAALDALERLNRQIPMLYRLADIRDGVDIIARGGDPMGGRLSAGSATR